MDRYRLLGWQIQDDFEQRHCGSKITQRRYSCCEGRLCLKRQPYLGNQGLPSGAID